jgi:hypothetical protein
LRTSVDLAVICAAAGRRHRRHDFHYTQCCPKIRGGARLYSQSSIRRALGCIRQEEIMIGRTALRSTFATLAIILCVPTAALARDSSRYVCSAVAEFRDGDANSKIGVSIDFYDSRDPGGSDGRKYVLSSIYQSKLFQGSMIDKSDKFGEGAITLRNGRSELFVGKFKLEQQKDDSYVMAIDGRINEDPGSSRKLFPIKAKLPCVDLSI